MILIVDDKQENVFSLKALLQLHGYEVDSAFSGEEALKKILRNRYRLIILDVQMPDMDGYEVAETVTGYSKTKNIPIIFHSAVNVDKRFITKGYASGGVDYITKPFDPDLLLLKVQTLSRLYQQTFELKQMQETLREEIEIRKEAQRKLEAVNDQLEQKVLERTADLEAMNNKLEVSNTELQQYASLASHDLQEPLRKITTFIRIVNQKFLEENEEAKEYVRKIISSTDRMRNLIDDLLNYSKLSGSSSFELIDLNTVVANTLNDLELSIQEKDALISIDNLPEIEAIPGQMRQVFQNIFSNALKFSNKERKPEIRLTANMEDVKDDPELQPGKYVNIAITDNGIGFDEKYLHKIFTIFQRLHGKAQYEGTGIGLAIVKKIIEKHKGQLHASSKEGKGATFYIKLPLRQLAAEMDTTIHS
jgi:signal transduction histidine kinase